MRKLLYVIPLLVLAPLAGACASASATSKSAERPALVIPLPPPHVVPLTPEPVVEPVAEIPAVPSAPPASRTGRGSRETPPRPVTENKPEAKPEAVPEAPVAPPPVTPPAPAPQLRPADSTGAEGAVRATIDRARNLLNAIDYRRLSTERKKAYDDAKRFAQQADDALKSGNTVFAQGVATKSETLAKELSGK
jgi:hypothetical protein